MPSLPLLRLPRLVLGEVFKSLNIGEKIQLSFCSKKVSTQINNARFYSQKVIVVLDCLNEKINVHSENNKETFEITTFWKNHRGGFLSVIRYLLKMFQCKISISNNYNSDLFQPTISMLFDLQVEFKKLTILLTGSKDHNLLWNQISKKLELVDDLKISSVPDPGFRPVFTSWSKTINIWRSYWFNLESVLTCTCSRITLELSNLGNKDLDEILKNWKAGGLPNLKHLRVESQRITNNGSTILGMAPLELREKEIQTDDGSKKATINTGYNIFEMFFEMLIYQSVHVA
ncbi:hypothetical protein GCK72_003127 [Caenorhabditis remanei]|uniref:F-box domain-containing protein n=1 Tax=Caenorhabditis remanei TaxID=31234 RepID=A0A6A5HVS9_CAERE|nr:hypothetical protein GCK72_003127 [Caenorhabditis remanei]KAF1771301.1 hypothetical protein GCK72_003127 [Caenorhabditis remanei]